LMTLCILPGTQVIVPASKAFFHTWVFHSVIQPVEIYNEPEVLFTWSPQLLWETPAQCLA
jgi:hypothetical protein